MTPDDGRRRKSQPSKIDWVAARQFWLDLDQRSFAAVAKQFGVSDTAVRNHARDEGWLRAAREYDDRVAEELSRRSVRTRASRIAQSFRVIDGLLARYEADVDELDLKVSDLPGIVKLAELLEGEATDRISVGEAQSVIRTAFLVFGRFVPLERRDEFRAAFAAELEGLPGLAIGPGDQDLAA